ncbi:uncharacterized protein PHACADRAFT_185054 [Phanerochaete carnosa HHB-10118-sp]|uniref:Uncharacterized protein n=1 Tax=Phanerochaete carnosa (strain HHB-10118-sp) TaxID=650164 RepID=K5W548_PHACS|nr:uncharacterized protein PHACADRAFT_185054 [Phanerochaete carnosa HHB-10118-sp]EKM54069.1 hypothetical protein PHACADRAFT_185054 [Phanerochaete carnosa HHB-10118-sp]
MHRTTNTTSSEPCLQNSHQAPKREQQQQQAHPRAPPSPTHPKCVLKSEQQGALGVRGATRTVLDPDAPQQVKDDVLRHLDGLAGVNEAPFAHSSREAAARAVQEDPYGEA